MSARGRLDSFLLFSFGWWRQALAGIQLARTWSAIRKLILIRKPNALLLCIGIATVLGWLFVGRRSSDWFNVSICLCDSSHTRRGPDEYIVSSYFFLDFLLLFGLCSRWNSQMTRRRLDPCQVIHSASVYSGPLLWLPPPCIIVQ
jgi:hypothetical protein